MAKYEVEGMPYKTYKEAYEMAVRISRNTRKGIEIKRYPPYRSKLLVISV